MKWWLKENVLHGHFGPFLLSPPSPSAHLVTLYSTISVNDSKVFCPSNPPQNSLLSSFLIPEMDPTSHLLRRIVFVFSLYALQNKRNIPSIIYGFVCRMEADKFLQSAIHAKF